MLGISLAMLIGSALLMLRLSSGGSFPSPLSQEEEKKYLTQWQNGDISSRNVLVEHNLRLVAHIIKKYYTQTNDIEDLHISIHKTILTHSLRTPCQTKCLSARFRRPHQSLGYDAQQNKEKSIENNKLEKKL